MLEADQVANKLVFCIFKGTLQGQFTLYHSLKST